MKWGLGEVTGSVGGIEPMKRRTSARGWRPRDEMGLNKVTGLRKETRTQGL